MKLIARRRLSRFGDLPQRPSWTVGLLLALVAIRSPTNRCRAPPLPPNASYAFPWRPSTRLMDGIVPTERHAEAARESEKPRVGPLPRRARESTESQCTRGVESDPPSAFRSEVAVPTQLYRGLNRPARGTGPRCPRELDSRTFRTRRLGQSLRRSPQRSRHCRSASPCDFLRRTREPMPTTQRL
jgi:hypothetical protein